MAVWIFSLTSEELYIIPREKLDKIRVRLLAINFVNRMSFSIFTKMDKQSMHQKGNLLDLKFLIKYGKKIF